MQTTGLFSHGALPHVTASLLLWLAAGCCHAQNAATAVPQQEEYVRVDDVSALADGDVVVIANAAYGYAMGKRQAANNRPGVKVQVEQGRVIPTEEVQPVTLEKAAGAWTLAVDDGKWLCATDSKTQQLKTTSTRSNLMLADISIAPSGNACIQFKGSKPCAMVMRFSHQSTAFNCYTSLTAVDSLQLYRRTRTVEALTLDGGLADLTGIMAENRGCRVRRLTLKRRLAADGGWHTLCLPFALTAADIAQVLGGADVEEFCAATTDADGNAVLQFRKVEATVAGRPYLVRVPAEVADPVFSDKTLTALQPLPDVLGTDGHARFTFVGTYAPVTLQGTAYRFLEAGGTRFVVPNGNGQVGATRAYFIFGDPAAVARCQFLSGTAGIRAPAALAGRPTAATAYSLSGQPLGKAAAQRQGIVVVNGRKIWRKK